jgi:hypothetical protein
LILTLQTLTIGHLLKVTGRQTSTIVSLALVMITTLTMNSMIGTIVNTKNYTAQLAVDGFGKTTFLDSVNTMLKMKQLTSKT